MEDFFAQFVAEERVMTLVRLSYLLGIAIILHFVVRLWLIKLLKHLYRHTNWRWYRLLVDHKVPQRALFLLPLIVLQTGAEWVPHLPENLTSFAVRLLNAIMILVVARTLDAVLEALHTSYYEHTSDTSRPIRSYIQLGKVIIYVFAIILIIAQIADRSPWYFLSGLGAMTAILLLVFRDTLLSLVASIQLTGNDLIKKGDWIEMNQFNADGPVVDIALNNVRVRNFDKTLTVIPTHKFLEHSFRNFRAMQESGGRRIKRSVNIDISSIRFLYPEEIERFRQSRFLKDYINRKMEELEAYHQQYDHEIRSPLDTRWLTNIGTFRAYIYEYLKAHPRINHDLFKLVRQHQPTAHGLPLEVYAFTNDTRWDQYEQIQADIFDHIFAVSPEFGLRLFQSPSGEDFKMVMGRDGLL